jgi:hypothetical protein
MTKHYEVKTTTGLTVKTNLNAKHKAFFPSTVLAILIGILVALLVPSLSDVIRITLAAILLTAALVVVLNNKARYAAIMFLRQVDQRLAATKTYGDKKPANHND